MRFAVAARTARNLLSSGRFRSSTTALGCDVLPGRRFFAATAEVLSSAQAPSKVLFMRSQADEITQEDLNDLIKPFGSINKSIVLRSGNEALLEMGDEEEAKSVMKHFSEEQGLLRGKEVHVEYSNRKKLSVDQPSQVPPHRVLLVIIHNPLYQINVDILHKVFSAHGIVEKIVIFQKTSVQAFIVLDSEEAAIAARSALNGRQIFDGCCKLDIKFSINEDVRVAANTEFTRDYTDDSLPTGASLQDPGSILGTGAAFAAANPGSPVLSGVLPYGVTGQSGKHTLLVSNVHEQVDEDKLYNLFSGYGRVLRIKKFDNSNQALIQLADALQAELAMTYLKGTPLLGTTLDVTLSKHNAIRHPRTRDYSADPYNRFNNEYIKNCCTPSKILHLSNLGDEVQDGDILNFLATHGVIQRVKIFDSNSSRKQALVEFDNVQQAAEALVFKHRSRVKGSSIRISFSRYHAIR